jgi:hypothetical protein
VPEDWSATDLNHGLGSILCFFAKTRSHSTCQNYSFHKNALFSEMRFRSNSNGVS